jgi:hypothetical protein
MTKSGRPGWARRFFATLHTNRDRREVLAIGLTVIGMVAGAAWAVATHLLASPGTVQPPRFSNTNSNNQNQGIIIQGSNSASVTLAPTRQPSDNANWRGDKTP